MGGLGILQAAILTRPPAGLSLGTAGALNDLGPEWDALFESGPGLNLRRAWFDASAEAAVAGEASPRYVLIEDEGGPATVVPMLAGPGRSWKSLTTPYTCLFQPLTRPGAAPQVLRRIGHAFGSYCRAWPVTVLEAMDPEWPGMDPFLAGLRDAGLAARRFEHFGNWYLGVQGWSWADYLQTRPGPLRETIRRKTKMVAGEPGLRLEIVQAPAALGPALAAYESVYARSWKRPEPFPLFNKALVERLAGSGVLRLGVMWAGDQPIAAQYWAILDGRATVLKLAHDDQFKRLSPGTVLTAHVIGALLHEKAIEELDFGRGDDAYKRAWAGHRRTRIGVLIAAPWSPRGAAALLRHDAGRAIRHVKRRARGLQADGAMMALARNPAG